LNSADQVPHFVILSVLLFMEFKYPPQHPAPNTLNLCAFLSVTDQASHPYKTTGKIRVL